VRVCVCVDKRRHYSVHEAAHAVAAVDFGVPFLQVSVLDEPVAYADLEGLEKNGGLAVDIDHLLPLWPLRADGIVPPSSMLAVALAGETAERVVLGHVVDDHGSIGDFRMYVGWLAKDGRRPRSWEEAKEREPATVDRVAAWAEERRGEIDSVATELSKRARLTRTEVVRLLG
jgi:hypothetical protein